MNKLLNKLKKTAKQAAEQAKNYRKCRQPNKLKIVSIVFKTSAIKKRKKTGNVVIWSFGHLVIWSFGHFDVFKENEKGTEGKKKQKKQRKK